MSSSRSWTTKLTLKFFYEISWPFSRGRGVVSFVLPGDIGWLSSLTEQTSNVSPTLIDFSCALSEYWRIEAKKFSEGRREFSCRLVQYNKSSFSAAFFHMWWWVMFLFGKSAEMRSAHVFALTFIAACFVYSSISILAQSTKKFTCLQRAPLIRITQACPTPTEPSSIVYPEIALLT